MFSFWVIYRQLIELIPFESVGADEQQYRKDKDERRGLQLPPFHNAKLWRLQLNTVYISMNMSFHGDLTLDGLRFSDDSTLISSEFS